MKQIIIEVGPEGEVKIEAVGFKGHVCEAATKAIEEALGVVASRKRKPEFQQSVVTAGRQKLGQ
jgi:hypothetical protein